MIPSEPNSKALHPHMHGLPDVPLEAGPRERQSEIPESDPGSLSGGCSKLGPEGLQRLCTLRLLAREPRRRLKFDEICRNCMEVW